MEQAIEERLKSVILEQMERRGPYITNITDNFNFRNGLDSLDIVEFIIEVEEEFDITISDDDWENAKTFRDVANLVKNEVS